MDMPQGSETVGSESTWSTTENSLPTKRIFLTAKKLESRKNKFLLAAGNKRSSKDGRREKARSTKSKNFAVLSKRQ